MESPEQANKDKTGWPGRGNEQKAQENEELQKSIF